MRHSEDGPDKVDEARLEKADHNDHNGTPGTSEEILALAYTSGKHPDPAHPLNLPRWRKWAALISLSWSALLASYGAAASLTAFPQIAKTLHVTIPDIAHSVGYALLGLAIGPLFWSAISMSAGRKPALILSSILFIPCVAWLASATSYNSYSAAQFFSGAASSATQTVPPMVIAEMFKKSERGDKLSTWAVAVLIGPGVSPLISAFIVSNKDWPWVYYILIILIGVQLISLQLFLPETQYIADESNATSGRIGVRYWPWSKPGQFMLLVVRPLLLSYLVPLTATAIYYGMVFGFAVGLTVVTPRVLAEFYAFDTQAQGLSYLAFIIGGILGKTAGGWFGDRIVLWKQTRTGERHPEYRLWAMLPLLPLLAGGLLIFGLCLQAKAHWSTILIGAGIHYAALCGSSGLLQTYMLESYLVEPVHAMVMSQFWRCMWGFAVPFFAFEWGAETSWQKEYITQAFLVLGFGLILCGSFIVYGQRLRRAQGMPSTDNM